MSKVTKNEIADNNNKIAAGLDDLQEMYIKKVYNRLPKNFEAIILSGIPEQHNSAADLASYGSGFESQNDNRYYFVRVRPLKTQGSILPDPFLALTLKVAKRIINAHPIAYIEVNRCVHPPTHGDVYQCRYSSKDTRGIVLVKRLRNSNKKIGEIATRELHKAFRGTSSPSLLGSRSLLAATSGGFVPSPDGVSTSLAFQGPVLAAANAGQPEKSPPNNGLACSVLVAIWSLNQMNKRPPESSWSQWQAWQQLDPEFWAKAQITGVGSGVGSTININAYQEKLGGSYVKYSKEQTSSGTGPVLTQGKWHIVQRWTHSVESPEEYDTGHSYLVYYGGGDTVRVIDSSHRNHYEDTTVSKSSWWSIGSEETVLTLPFGG